jgi:hypothetical protein
VGIAKGGNGKQLVKEMKELLRIANQGDYVEK